MTLLSALQSRFSHGLEYSDAVQMCLWLHLRVNKLPSECGEFAGDRAELAKSFATLARIGGISDSGDAEIVSPSFTEEKHWSGVIDSIYKGNASLDRDLPGRFPDVFME